MTAAGVRKALRAEANPVRAQQVARFFKTGPGEYGEGDIFIGVTVPAVRRICRHFHELPLEEGDKLLTSRIHEERLAALLILADQFQRAAQSVEADVRKQIFALYIRRLRFINNWDLVDSSAPQIIGGWLIDKPRELLDRLARSKDLWSRRVAMVATLHFIVRGDHRDAIRIAGILVNDRHDLIQKAVGWMLREVGKRASDRALTRFLERHAATMPRTTLRYAIERLPARDRRHWMDLRKTTPRAAFR
jgi:3-methyladenine DNA glycosylase AlkD